MSRPVRPSYQFNLNRNPTRKWAEAQQVDYDGDDWGDNGYDDYEPSAPEPEPISAGPQRHPGWGQRSGQASQRSFTNPVQPSDFGRSSFERDDERRNFSTGASDPRFQMQPPLGQSQHRGPPESSPGIQNDQRDLHLNTQMPSHSSASITQSNPRADPYTDVYGVPHSAPVGHSSHSLQTDSRSRLQTAFGPGIGQEQQYGGSDEAEIMHVPRGSSLNQEQAVTEFGQPRRTDTIGQSSSSSQALDQKPLPFVRPADIYKRMEEEREKERRSQESSRPSIDSATGAVGGSPDRLGEKAPTKLSGRPLEEGDTSRRMKPTLNTVTERDSEYGMSPTSARSGHSTTLPSAAPLKQPAGPVRDEYSRGSQARSPAASSVYSDRPDPASASSTRSPYQTAFGTRKSPVLDYFRQPIPQYSPSTRKPSGLRSDPGRVQVDDDLPNFDHAISPNHSMTSETVKAVQADASGDRSSPTKSTPEDFEDQRPLGHDTVAQQPPHVENNSALSPVSTNEALRRSSSNSTSEISPINERKSRFDHAFSQMHGDQSAKSPEASATIHGFGGHSAAAIPHKRTPEDVRTTATTLLPDSHRNDGHPTMAVGESSPRRPLSIEIPSAPESQHPIVSTVAEPSTTIHAPKDEILLPTQFNSTTDKNSPPKASIPQSELAPPYTSRSASEDYHDWQNQRRHFNAKHGFDDSTAGSPAVSSPISRAESPVKGTVRDIAGKLESNSGRASPVNIAATENRPSTLDKPLHTRNESFRPALPGGWLSYTTDTNSADNVDELVKSQPAPQRPVIQEQARAESTDSIPTAVAPKNWKPSNPGPIEAAFAAAAAAGTAMAGAFSGPSRTHDTPQYSEADSEEDSSSGRSHQDGVSDSRDFASLSANPPVHDPAPVIPEPQTRDSVAILPEPRTRPAESQSELPQSGKTFTIESEGSPQHVTGKIVDFPAPLRTNRNVDNKQPSPRLSIPIIPSSSEEQDPEQLQYDIVQSLTPKTSSMDSVATRELETLPKLTGMTPTLPSQPRTVSESHDVLPQAYTSYWNGPQTPPMEEHRPEQTLTSESTPVAAKPPIPTAAVAASTGHSERPPFLEQRYSWETGTDDRDKGAVLPSSELNKGVEVKRSVTPPLAAEPPRVVTPPTPIAHKPEEESSDVSRDEEISTASPSRSVLPSSFPKAKTEFRNIISFGDPSQRIRAFDENRQAYAEPNGLLDQWLSSMNTSEHADVFNLGRLPRASTSTAPNEIRPSPRRDLTSSSGTKQMQEDGRRLLAAAGKYSGKAGTAAKGFFSKQKDKLRTVGSGDKVPTLRRRSGNIEVDTSPVPRQRDPIPSERAPQLPTPSLETPPEEKSWSSISSKIDQMFSDRTSQSNPNMTGSALPPGMRTSMTGTKPPPPAVVASLPSNQTAAAKPAAFPNYDAGIESTRDTAIVGGHRQSKQLLTPGNEVRSKTTTESNRFSAPPRNDSLPLPRQRRPSTISDVSEISAVPDEPSEVAPRNVSPALDSQSRKRGTSLISPQLSRKEEEAKSEPTNTSEAVLPAYSTARDETNVHRQPQILPGAQIVPVTDLKTTERTAPFQSTGRPFSFIGSETLNHAISQEAGVMPQAQTLQRSPDSSGILTDIEKSPQPNITEHPAYRNDNEEPVTENPLPSSRRPPQDFEQGRQRQQAALPQKSMGEEGYRIPGPYVQEFRSPRSSKPTLGQDLTQQPYEPSQQNARAPGSQERLPEQAGRTTMVGSRPQIEQRRETDRDKGRLLGGMFQSRSRSRPRSHSRPGAKERDPGLTQEDNNATAGSKSFKGLFGLGNRSSSPSHQAFDSRREQTSTPEPRRDRKLSFDMLRPSASTAKLQTETKKKRSSGFGALFGISGTKERDSQRLERKASVPMTHDSQRQLGLKPEPAQRQTQYPNSASSHQYNVGNSQRSASPQDQLYPHHSQQPQYPSSHDPVANDRYGASDVVHRQSGSNYGPAERRPDHDQSPITNQHSTTERPQIYSDPSSNSITAISSAFDPYLPTCQSPVAPISTGQPIPVTRANRDISYGQSSYIPQPSPVSKTGLPPTQPKTEIADHVKNPHKRSRSPRLGRPPSDEQLRGDFSDQTTSNPATQHLAAKPVDQLGVFNNRKLSPAGGIPRSNEEQEKPWIIGLPDDGENESNDSDARKRGRVLRFEDDNVARSSAPTSLVSPSSPQRHGQRDTVADTVSPVTAVEPKSQGFHRDETIVANSAPRRMGSQQRRMEERDQQIRQRQADQLARQPQADVPDQPVLLPVPPSISSAPMIPHPQTRSHENVVPTATDLGASGGRKTPTFHSQITRDSKRISIEHAPVSPQTATPVTSRPLTVAEKVMGIQPAAHGTTPDHQSTTPVPPASAPSAGMHSKSTTWPEERPSTAAVTTTNNSGTTVTTTTMRTGSKLGKGNLRTSTYIVGSNPPSRTGSSAASIDKRSSGGNILGGTSTTASPLTTSASNTIGNRGLQPSTGSSQTSNVPGAFPHGKSFEAFELPGSRPDGYESEEEVVMSATAYPGQEWMPDYAIGASWDD